MIAEQSRPRARSEEGAYREYVTDERHSDAKQIGDLATEGKPIGALELFGGAAGWREPQRGPDV